MNDEETIFWIAFIGIFVLVAYLALLGCAALPALQHQRSSMEIDYTKPIPEIPEQAW